MYRLQLIGVLGNDAEVREVGNRKVISFNVAIKMDYKDSSGTSVKKTEWVNAAFWNGSSQSTKVADFLKKGKRVLIEGRPGIDTYVNKEGVTTSSLTVTIDDLELLN